MSFDVDEWLFTDTESRFLSPLLRDDPARYAERLEHNRLESIRLLHLEAVKAVSHLHTIEQIHHKLIRKIINHSLDVMIDRYAISESLPDDYTRLARHLNALPILLKGFFKAHSQHGLDAITIGRIEVFCEEVYINDELDIVYDRVSHVQRFIHDMVNKENGVNHHLTLPVSGMRNLLSATRLHLNIIDFKYRDAEALVAILKRSKEASDAERAARGGTVLLARGKRYIKNWRVLQLDSLFQFQTQEVAGRILGLLAVNKDQEVKAFKEESIGIYSGKIEVSDIPDWRQRSRWAGPAQIPSS